MFKKKTVVEERPVDTLYQSSYESFCREIIEIRIVQRKEIFRLTSLTNMFVKFIQKDQGIDASTYRPFNLKRRLQKSHPQLQFIQPTSRRESQLVMVRSIQVEDVKDSLMVHEGMSSSESEGTSTDDEHVPEAASTMKSVLRDAYFTARSLREDCLMVNSSQPWPTTGKDLSLDVARRIVPVRLYNFLAWTIGASNDPLEDRCVTVEDHWDRRILSLAQDIIYSATKGRRQLPKQSALAMAVRHTTGSAKMISLLNGFGHTTSHSAVLEHDTALAESQLRKTSILPHDIHRGRFTTVVWDNIDFGEETLSGRGTTHGTNGIIVQRSKSGDRTDSTSQQMPKVQKTKKRSLQPPLPNLATYYGGQKAGPSSFGQQLQIAENQSVQSTWRKLDLAYVLSRIDNTTSPLIPSWTGFNTMMSREKGPPQVSNIGYLPLIDASPTEMDTVETILQRSIEIADAVEMRTIVVVFDQAIYAKAQSIRWKKKLYQERIVIRLGAFHTSMAFLACIGRRFGDAGLRDVAIESEVVATGSLNGVISGHHYNRSIRFHKLLFEALHRLRWQAFLSSAEQEVSTSMNEVLTKLKSSFPLTFSSTLSSTEVTSVIDSYNQFVCESQANPLFEFWSSYVEMVQLLLLFIRASREGEWQLHLSTLRSMMPWFMAYDRVNYARYSSVYWLEMQSIDDKHPTISEEFHKGEFCVQRQDRHRFAGIPMDMCIEQTANRDAKTRGGLTGITTNKGAVHRWISSYHLRAEIARSCEEMAGTGETVRQRKDLDATRNQKDEDDVQSIMQTIEATLHPFTKETEELVHLTSGVVATTPVAKDLSSARERGEEAVQRFVVDRLQNDNVGFFAPLKKMNLKTFSALGVKKKVAAKGKIIEIKSSRTLFARLLLCGSSRKLCVEKMLEYSLGPLPLALSTPHGTLVKHPKANLMHHIESLVRPEPYITSIPSDCVWIIDGMAMIQQLRVSELPSTFGDLASLLLTKLLKIANSTSSKEIHFVTDRYPLQSIKNAERSRRASEGVQTVRILAKNMKVPKQWKKFLNHGPNKEELVRFLFEAWKETNAAQMGRTKIFLAHDSSCHSFCNEDGELLVEEIEALSCDHEEADTRLLLHTKHVSERTKDVIIKSPDTDVFVIAVALCAEITTGSNIYFQTGQKVKRIVDVNRVAANLGPQKSSALLGLHSFTGCDSVSSFYGKGKVKAWKVMEETEEYEAFIALGKNLPPSNDLLSKLESFTCALYSHKKCSSVNDARYQHFKQQTKALESAMPPNQDCLHRHIYRANYQAGIWRGSVVAAMNLPSPVHHGWKLDDGNLVVDWMSLAPAPDELLELTYCSCKKKRCDSNHCSCASHGLPCSDLCSCVDCMNYVSESDEEDEPSDDSDEEVAT